MVSKPEDLVQTIAGEGVRDPCLLEAVRTVPRAGFVPASLAWQAYEDRPLPIPHGQVTTQPSLVARMVEALELAGSERVLEVGAGYAWQRRCSPASAPSCGRWSASGTWPRPREKTSPGPA